MTIKIIDLLNKIANGEEVPKKIKHHWEYEYKFDEMRNEYCYINNQNERFDEEWLIMSMINDEVEIIEEDKDIEKLKIEQDGSTYYIKNEHGTKCYLTKHSYLIADKVNQLIDEVKKLKGKYE